MRFAPFLFELFYMKEAAVGFIEFIKTPHKNLYIFPHNLLDYMIILLF